MKGRSDESQRNKDEIKKWCKKMKKHVLAIFDENGILSHYEFFDCYNDVTFAKATYDKCEYQGVF